MTEGSMARDTYFRAGYDTALAWHRNADPSALHDAIRAIREQMERTRYDSHEGKSLLGALAALSDLADEQRPA